MIPPDVASALRVALIESQNQAQLPQRASPVAPTQRITDALSNLVPGQRIFAEVQGMQANGTYRALVGQREITLSLPFSAKAGDSLELEVSESDGKITLAFVANRTEQASKLPADSVATQLSRTAQLIGELQGNVDSPGKRAPPVQLNGNQALIQRMPETGAELAPVLKQAVTQSGVFYEAHQARWIAGQIPTTALRQEPQGRISVTPTPNPAALHAPPSGNGSLEPSFPKISPSSGQTTTAPMVYAESKASLLGASLLPTSPSAQSDADKPLPSDLTFGSSGTSKIGPNEQAHSRLIQSTPELKLEPESKPLSHSAHAVDSENTQKSAQAPRESGVTTSNPARQDSSTPQPASGTSGLPKEISGIVQQQLDGLATQNFVWQGQAWAGQLMQWEISTAPDGRSPNGEEADNRLWQTRLKLTLPQLGGIDAVIRLQHGGQVAISLNADSSNGELLLRGASEPLAQQLAAAGLTLTQLQINHEPGAK